MIWHPYNPEKPVKAGHYVTLTDNGSWQKSEYNELAGGWNGLIIPMPGRVTHYSWPTVSLRVQMNHKSPNGPFNQPTH